jgi:hypothetical protein
MGVVPPFDEVEHRHARLSLGFETGTVKECSTSTIFADERQLFLPVVARLTGPSVR